MKRCLILIKKLSVEGNKTEGIHGWPEQVHVWKVRVFGMGLGT